MFRSRIFVGMLLMFAVGMLLVTPGAKAGNNVWEKKTTITFSQPFEIPGTQTLPAGTYVFRVLDQSFHQEMVQIANADETHVYALVHVIPSVRPHVSEKTAMSFEETGARLPEMLRTWYHPGEKSGHEFAYIE